MKLLLFFVLSLMTLGGFAERYGFDRYECILTRRMFGEVPPGFDPMKKPSEVSKSEQKELSKEQEKLQSAIHFSVINVTPEGHTMVGFTDNSNGKEPRHYYLKVGDQRDGWLVKEADPTADPQTMTIVKDGIEVSLTIGGDSAKGGGTTVRASSSGSQSLPVRPVAAADRPPPRSPHSTLAGRRRLKQEKLQQEAEAKAEAKYNAKFKELEEKDREREDRLRESEEKRNSEFEEVLRKVREQKGKGSQNSEVETKGDTEAKEE